MKTFRADVTWRMGAFVEVQAEDEREARRKVLRAGLPKAGFPEGEYCDDSFVIHSIEETEAQ